MGGVQGKTMYVVTRNGETWIAFDEWEMASAFLECAEKEEPEECWGWRIVDARSRLAVTVMSPRDASASS